MKTLLLQVVGLALVYFAAADDLTCESNEILRGFKSDYPFFIGYAEPLCNYFGKRVCAEMTKLRNNIEASDSNSYRLSVACPFSRQVIQRAVIDVYDNGQPYSLTIYCCTLVDSLSASRPYIRDSSASGNKRVNCGSKAAMRNITLDYSSYDDSSYEDSTQATVTCVGLN